MAIYHLAVKSVSRSTGRSAVAAVAYRAGVCLENERDGLVHDYTRRGGVEDAFIVRAATRLLVVEGNYLLLATAPWWRVKPLLDRSVFVSVPRETVRERLMKRHGEEGLFTEERNREHIERVDLANYDVVTRSQPRADIAIEIVTPA